MTAVFARTAVLGLGLIGGSLLRALHSGGYSAIGYDTDEATREIAHADGYAVAGSAATALEGADLVVIAVPLPDLPAAIESLHGVVETHAVITDVGTLKAPVHALIRAALPLARFIGGHPLAGTEQSGWAATDPLLFRDCPWALTLEPDTDLPSWLRLAALVCDLGSRPVPATATEQDAAVARVIGLPHMLAEALALTGLDGGPLGLSLAAGSYTSGSRVARTRPELVATWCDGNNALTDALDDVIERLRVTRDALSEGRSVLPLARAGYQARIGWENRRFEQVELPASAADLLAHGQAGGWITAVLPVSDPAAPDGGERRVRLLGMRPAADLI